MARKRAAVPPAPAPLADRSVLLGLLEECKQTPQDDAPRLVLADWLEEHGDESDRARAATVRRELVKDQAERMGISDGALVAGDDSAAILKYCQRWLGPVDFLCQSGTPPQLRRGMWCLPVEPRQFLTQIAERLAGSEEYAWVEGLAFHHLRPEEVGDVLASPLLGPISHLQFDGYTLGRAGLERLFRADALPNLRSLWLTYLRMNDEAVGELARSRLLDHLLRLNLRGNRIGPPGVTSLACSPHVSRLKSLNLAGASCYDPACIRDLVRSPYLANLRELELNSTGVTGEGVRCLGGPDGLAALEVLHLRDVNAGAEAARALAGAGQFAALRRLDLTHNPLGTAGLAALAHPASLPRLETLILEGSDVTADGLAILARGPLLERLRVLRLTDNRLGGPGAAALAASPARPRLAWLDLSSCDLGPEGLEELARWPGLAGVNGLGLENNGLDVTSARALADSPHLGSLHYLHLGSNNLGSRGVQVLARAEWLSGLEHLDLGYNHLGELAVDALVRCPRLGKLRYLGFAGNPGALSPSEQRVCRRLTQQLQRHFGKDIVPGS